MVAATPQTETTSAEARAAEGLRQTACKLVGEVFYGTLLRQYRSMSPKAKYGHGGRGEEIFQGQLDQIFAERAGSRTRGGLADAIVQRFERRVKALAAYRAANAPAAATKGVQA